eukprot:1327093-Rhodomonas_salina.1
MDAVSVAAAVWAAFTVAAFVQLAVAACVPALRMFWSSAMPMACITCLIQIVLCARHSFWRWGLAACQESLSSES